MDVEVYDGGSVVMVYPLSPEARAWVEDNVGIESWQWMGGGFACERRYVCDLLEGMAEDGLAVAS